MLRSIIFAALALTTAVSLQAKEPLASIRDAGPEIYDSSAVNQKVVYLDFFASWCAPCKLSFPFMKSLYRQFADKGLVIIAVDVDKDSTEADAFLELTKPPFTIVRDSDGKLAKQFDLKAMPTSFVYSRDGTLQQRHQGFEVKDTVALKAMITQLLQEKPKQ